MNYIAIGFELVSVIAPNTGLQRQSVLSAITLIFTATGLILVAGAYGKRQPVKNK